MPCVLVTGANRGLGLELSRQYAEEGWRVLAACRDPGQATALAALPRNVTLHPLDVSDRQAARTLAEALGDEAIDLLIHNAGVYGPRDSELGHIDFAAWHDVLDVNLLGPLRVTEAFVQHVARSDLRRMAFISSKMGSIGANQAGGDYVYRSSKAGLNATVKSLALDLAPRGITVVTVHPGWVSTDMGGSRAPVSLPESASHMRRLFDRLTHADSGRFFNYDGTELPW